MSNLGGRGCREARWIKFPHVPLRWFEGVSTFAERLKNYGDKDGSSDAHSTTDGLDVIVGCIRLFFFLFDFYPRSFLFDPFLSFCFFWPSSRTAMIC